MEKQYLVLLMLEGLQIPDCSRGSFFPFSVAFWAYGVFLNIVSSKNFKSHGANVYKEEQFPFLIFHFLGCDKPVCSYLSVLGIIQPGFLGITECFLLLLIQYWF